MDERNLALHFPKLSSNNYVQWARTMEHFIRSKGLWGFVDGSKTEPQLILTKHIDRKAHELMGEEKEKTVTDYEKKWEDWKIGHHKVIAWFLTCVDTSTCGRISRFSHAHEAWDYLKQTHTVKDVAYLHNLQVKIMNLRQGDKSINDFVAEIDQLYDEMSLFEPKFVDPQDITLWEKYVQRDKFYKFVIGLKADYDGVKTSLLHRAKVPPMREAIAEVKMQENRLNLDKEKDDSILATSRPGNNMRTYRPPHFNRQNDGKKKIICYHCQEEGHIKPRCPKLRNSDKRNFAAPVNDDKKDHSFDLDQLMNALQPKIMEAIQQSVKGSSSISGATVASTSAGPLIQEDDWGRF
ncbi:unnamed protein product [Victoria cruziana]